jgi:Glu-tRNA(Gln) amidotransferase subunit E-like FAD-binding protein
MEQTPPGLVAAMVYLREQNLLAREAEFALAQDLMQGGAWREGMIESECTAFLDIAIQRAVELGLEPADAGALRGLIESLVEERLDFVTQRGMGAIGPLMGIVMGQAQGVDGKEVSAILREIIQQHI